MRTKIEAFRSNSVRLSYVDHDGNIKTREFYIPHGGGYVREYANNRGDDPQVCEYLSRGGWTLRAGSQVELLALVRREWVRGKRMERNAR